MMNKTLSMTTPRNLSTRCLWRICRLLVSLLFVVVVFLFLYGAFWAGSTAIKWSGVLSMLSSSPSPEGGTWDSFSYKSCILPAHYSSYSLFRNEVENEREAKDLPRGEVIETVSALPTKNASTEIKSEERRRDESGVVRRESTMDENDDNANDAGLVDQIVLVIVDGLRPDYIFPQLSLLGNGDGCGVRSERAPRAGSIKGQDGGTAKGLFNAHGIANEMRDFCPVEWNKEQCAVQKSVLTDSSLDRPNPAVLPESRACTSPSRKLLFMQQSLMDPADPSVGLLSYADYPTATIMRLSAIASGTIPGISSSLSEAFFNQELFKSKSKEVHEDFWPQHCSPACCGRDAKREEGTWLNESTQSCVTECTLSPVPTFLNAGIKHEISDARNGNTSCACPCRSPSVERILYPQTPGVLRDSLFFQLDGRATLVGDCVLFQLYSAFSAEKKNDKNNHDINRKLRKTKQGDMFWKENLASCSFDINLFQDVDKRVAKSFFRTVLQETVEECRAPIQAKQDRIEKVRQRLNYSYDTSLHGQLLIAHLLEMDDVGHYIGNLDRIEMVSAIGRTNSFLLNVSDTLSSRNTSMRTLLVVMGDHGSTSTGTHGGSTPSETGTFAFAKYYPPTIGKYAPPPVLVGTERNAHVKSANTTEKWRSSCATTRSSLRSPSSLPLTPFQQRKLAELIDERRSENLDKKLRMLLETCLWDQHASSEASGAQSNSTPFSSLTSSLSPLFPFPHKISASYQMDWTATMAVLLGLPIPHDNLGRVIPEVMALVHYSRWNEVFRTNSQEARREKDGQGAAPTGEVAGADDVNRISAADQLSLSSFRWLLNRLEYCNWRQVSKLLPSEEVQNILASSDPSSSGNSVLVSTSLRRPSTMEKSQMGSSVYSTPSRKRTEEGNNAEDGFTRISVNDEWLARYVNDGFVTFLQRSDHRYVGYRSYLAREVDRQRSLLFFVQTKVKVMLLCLGFGSVAVKTLNSFWFERNKVLQERLVFDRRGFLDFLIFSGGFMWSVFVLLTLWILTQIPDAVNFQDLYLKMFLLFHMLVTAAVMGCWCSRPVRCLVFCMLEVISSITLRWCHRQRGLSSSTTLEDWAKKWLPAAEFCASWKSSFISFVFCRVIHVPFVVVALLWWIDMYSHLLCGFCPRSPFFSAILRFFSSSRRGVEFDKYVGEMRSMRAGTKVEGEENAQKMHRPLSVNPFHDFRTYSPFIVALLMGLARDVVYVHFLALVLLAVWGPRVFCPREARKVAETKSEKEDCERPNGCGATMPTVEDKVSLASYSPGSTRCLSSNVHNSNQHFLLFRKTFRYYIAIMWIVSLHEYSANNNTGAIVAAFHGCLLPSFFYTFLAGSHSPRDGRHSDSFSADRGGTRWGSRLLFYPLRVSSLVSFSFLSSLWLSAILVYLTALYGFYVSGQQFTFNTVGVRAFVVGLPTDTQVVTAIQSPFFRFIMVPEDTLSSVAFTLKYFFGGCGLFYKTFYPVLLVLPAFEISGVIKTVNDFSSSSKSFNSPAILDSDKVVNCVLSMKAVVKMVISVGFIIECATLMNYVWNYSDVIFASHILIRIMFMTIEFFALLISVFFTDVNSIPRWLSRLHKWFVSLFVNH